MIRFVYILNIVDFISISFIQLMYIYCVYTAHRFVEAVGPIPIVDIHCKTP